MSKIAGASAAMAAEEQENNAALLKPAANWKVSEIGSAPKRATFPRRGTLSDK